jgi:hypothetical protein
MRTLKVLGLALLLLAGFVWAAALIVFLITKLGWLVPFGILAATVLALSYAAAREIARSRKW